MTIDTSVKTAEVEAQLKKLAPLNLAESWDQVGLQWGDPNWPVSRGLLCIDLTEPVMQEAIDRKAQFILSYHPPMFSPLKRITTSHWKARLALKAIQHQIAVYSPHTALDSVFGGVNDWLAGIVGGESDHQVTSLTASDGIEASGEMKLVTFVPEKDLDAVRDAMAAAGAGQIGEYAKCSFISEGVGTFQGSAASNPAVGQAGQLEKVAEYRMEMVAPKRKLSAILKALMASHPYEEVAFDLYPLSKMTLQDEAKPQGTGRKVLFKEAAPLSEIANRLKSGLYAESSAGGRDPWRQLCVIPPIQDSGGPFSEVAIRSVALCAGAGYSVLEKTKADLLITGEMRHHDQLAVAQSGKWVLLAGHTETERPFLTALRDRLANMDSNQVDWQVSQADSGIMKEI